MDASRHESGFGLAVAIRQSRPDLVLLDLDMPGLGGEGALRALRALDPGYGIDVKVILHSGITADELAAVALRSGAVGWLRKPATPAQILAEVRRALAGTPGVGQGG